MSNNLPAGITERDVDDYWGEEAHEIATERARLYDKEPNKSALREPITGKE